MNRYVLFGPSVLILIVFCAALLIVGGCAKSPAELEMADDADCRKIITERQDTRPDAYSECRAHLADYRRSRAIAVSGSTTIVKH